MSDDAPRRPPPPPPRAMPRPRVPAPAPRGAEAATQSARGQPEAQREVSSARVVASPDEASGTFQAGSDATNTKPPETDAKPRETVAKAPETHAKAPETHAKPPETDAKSPETDAKPPETDAKPPETDAKPREAHAKPPETDAKPGETDDTSERGGRVADEGARSEDAAKRDEAPAPARESMPIVVETESPRDASARPLSEPPTRTAVPGPEPAPRAVSRIGSPESLEGVTLGRYVLRHLIAQGGMASVYLAQHVADDGFARWVAIKIMHPHLAREPRFVAMFLDEARITSRIVHPNVCAVTDYGKGPPPHLVMEHLFGEALWALVREAAPKGGIPVWLALRVVADAARGLHAAHEARGADGENLEVVHRDVSMQNVFVLYDGVTKVIDFGVAKARERLSSTETGELKGKIAYMAPDVLSGETADRRADVWGLGVVLWELLTNRRLFRGANEGATVHNVLHAPVPAVASIRKDVPPALDAILARALERDLSRRYKTAGQLADALEEQLASIGGVHGAVQVAAWMGEVLAEKKAAREKLLRALGDDPHARAEPLLRDDGWLEPSDAKEMALGTAVRRPGRAWAAAAALLLGLVLSVTLGWTLAPGSEPVATSPGAPRAEGVPGEGTPATTTTAADPRAIADPAAGEEAAPATTEGAATAVEVAATSGETETSAVAGAAVLEPTADPETPRAERSERSRRGSRSGTASGTDEPRAPSGTASSGRLNLMAIPPAEVFLGGRSLGRTPLVNVTLPAGRHQLTLRPIGGGTARTTTVTIRPGERTLESVRL